MSDLGDKILLLAKQLYPTGRAFKMPENGFFEKLHKGLGVSEQKAYEDALSTFNSLLPDNPYFDEDDATDWERRLGLITNETVSLSDRKAAILRKMQHPGVNPSRNHWLNVQYQLRLSGFNVWVYENRFLYYYPDGFITKNPLDVLPVGFYLTLGMGQLGDGQLGDSSTYYSNYLTPMQLGNFQLGDMQMDESVWSDRVINNIEQNNDKMFKCLNLKQTFFVGGNPIGTFANIPAARKDEFRQTILKLKPAQSVAFLFCNYV